ncbi:MAG: J domain-containing protein [bacterium]
MKRKFFATLAMFILVIIGALSPVLSFLGERFEAQPVYAQSTTTDQTSTASAASADKLECGFNVLCAIVTGYVAFVQFLPHLFAQISGMLLDWVVWKNLQSDTWTSQDSVDSFVVKGWKLVRDFSNLFFIFALFMVAFSLILNGIGTDQQPLFGLDPKRTIAQVILMALLINFSFFMCRVIIDITNLAGNIFYNKITVIDNGGTNTQQTTTDSNGKINMGTTAEFYSNFTNIRSVSLGILAKVNPQKLILQGGDIQGVQHTAAFGKISWYEYDMGVYVLLLFVSTITGIFNIFLIYLFLSSAIFLISRIYGLFFLIILSPIAFISTAIPGLQSKEYFGFDDWFKQLTGLAFCMPIYLFFMYLAIFFLGVGEKITNDAGYIALGTVITIKLVSMGAVLIFGKKIAKDLSGKFGAMASNAVTGIVTGAAMVAGAAMTGGASAALSMSGRVAQRGAASVARGVGGAIVGDEKAQEWEQKLRGMNGGGLRRLNNFNPLRDMQGKTLNQQAGQFFRNFGAATGEMARMAGSTAPDQIANGFNTGGRYGSRVDLKNQIKQVDAELIAANKKFYDPNTSAAEKEQLRTEIMVLEAKKKAIQNGTYVQGTPPPNAGTSGTNTASSGNNQAPNNGAQNATTNGGTGGNGGNGGGSNATGNNGGNNGGGPRPNNGGTGGNNAGGPTGGRGAGGTGGNFNGANGNTNGGAGNANSGNAGGAGTTSNASSAPSPHDLLGVDKDATWEEVKKAYRKKTLENHPDRGGDEETFRKIKDAYEQLAKDPRYANKNTSRPGPTQNSTSSTTSNATSTNNSTSGPSAQKPVATTMNLLSGINSYNSGTFAPRNTGQPIGQLSLRQDAVVPKPQGVAGALALGMGSSTAPAAIALNPTSGSTSGISLSQGGTATPLAPVKRQLGDGLGPKPTYTPVQELRFDNKAASAVSRGAAVQAGIERKQAAQQSAPQTITQKVAAVEVPLKAISPVLGATPLGDKTVSVGTIVDTAAKLNNPLTQYIPEVGPELKLAGKIATAAKNIGVTAPPKQMNIPIPPSVKPVITSSNPQVFNQLSNEQDQLIANNIKRDLDSNNINV